MLKYLTNNVKRVLTCLSLFILLLMPLVSYGIPVKAVKQDCFAWFFSCKDRDANTTSDKLLEEIDVQKVKLLSSVKKEEIKTKLKSTDKKVVQSGLEELFNLSVKEEWQKYIQGRASKDDKENLRKFFEGIKDARTPLNREFMPMVNTWQMMNNLVNFGGYLMNVFFLDFNNQLPDVFGKFDYADNTKTMSQKAGQAFSFEGGALKLDGAETINLFKIYYSLIMIVFPIWGIYLLIKYGSKGWFEWEHISKVLSEVLIFFSLMIFAPMIVSGFTLFTNQTTLATQQAFQNNTNTSEVCKDTQTMLCAYKISFSNYSEKEAIFANPEQFVLQEEDAPKYITTLISELFNNIGGVIINLINIIIGILVLFFWKGVILFLLMKLIFMVVLLPFSLINPNWRLSWFNQMASTFMSVFGFTLCYTLSAQLVLSVLSGAFAYWSISFIFICTAFLIFQAMPLISSIFGFNLKFKLNSYGKGKSFIQSQAKQSTRRFSQFDNRTLKLGQRTSMAWANRKNGLSGMAKGFKIKI